MATPNNAVDTLCSHAYPNGEVCGQTERAMCHRKCVCGEGEPHWGHGEFGRLDHDFVGEHTTNATEGDNTVRQLREFAIEHEWQYDRVEIVATLHKAADEIARLRAENDALARERNGLRRELDAWVETYTRRG